MNGPEELARREGVLHTRMGACFPGERAVFRGHDLHTELKDLDWLALYLYGITGRRFTPTQLQVLHAIWVYTSYPDARIWNNRVAALAGSARSMACLGVAAALALSDARIYGAGPARAALLLLREIRAATLAGKNLEEVLQAMAGRHFFGYGRPIVASDERIGPMMDLLASLGLERGAYVELAFSLEQALLERNPLLRMNFAGLAAAIALDMGFGADEFHLFFMPAFLAGMPPCHIEAVGEPAQALFPMTCKGILYEGPAGRRWPDRGRSTGPAGGAAA